MKHIAANHRGDDPDTIGSFPCQCAADLEDMAAKERRLTWALAKIEDTGLTWALAKIEKIFREARERERANEKVSINEAFEEFFNGRK